MSKNGIESEFEGATKKTWRFQESEGYDGLKFLIEVLFDRRLCIEPLQNVKGAC